MLHRSVNSYPAGQECLRLIEGMELAASRLECRRYGGYVGATTEFSKMEVRINNYMNILHLLIMIIDVIGYYV
jgi:hypothetical protein